MSNYLQILTNSDYIRKINGQSINPLWQSVDILNRPPYERQLLNSDTDYQQQSVGEVSVDVDLNDELFEFLVNEDMRQFRAVIVVDNTDIFHGFISSFSCPDIKSETISITLQNMLGLLKMLNNGGKGSYYFDGLAYMRSVFSQNPFFGVVFDDALPVQPATWFSDTSVVIKTESMPSRPANTNNGYIQGYCVEGNQLTHYAMFRATDFPVGNPATQRMFCFQTKIYNGNSGYMEYKTTSKQDNNQYTDVDLQSYRLSSFYSNTGVSWPFSYDGGFYSGTIQPTGGGFYNNLALVLNQNGGYQFSKIYIDDSTALDGLKAWLLIKNWRLVCELNRISIAYNGGYYSGQDVTVLEWSDISDAGIDFDSYTPEKSGAYDAMKSNNDDFSDYHFGLVKRMINSAGLVVTGKVRSGYQIRIGGVVVIHGFSKLAGMMFRVQELQVDNEDKSWTYFTVYRVRD